MKKTLYAAAICIPILSGLLPTSLHAQDAHFSQFYNAPLTINPAQAGNFNGDLRLIMNYKNQWSSIANPYKTIDVALDFKMMDKKWKNGFLGVGIYVMNDNAGDATINTNQANLSLAGVRYLDASNNISLGVQAGYTQSSLNSSGLSWGTQYQDINGIGAYNPSAPSLENSLIKSSVAYPDFGTGANWSFSQGASSGGNDHIQANAGVAVFHFTNPNTSLYSGVDDKLQTKFIVHGGMNFGISGASISIIPSFLYSQQGATQEINIGTMARYTLSENSRYTGRIAESAVSFGLYYRVNDAVIPSAMLEYANYAIGLSYDINVSGLNPASSGMGGLEISLRFMNPNPFGKGGGSNRNVRFL